MVGFAFAQVRVVADTSCVAGLLVWARTPGHWPFPAEIADPNDPDTPRALVDSKPPRAEHEELIPVRRLAFLGIARTKPRFSAGHVLRRYAQRVRWTLCLGAEEPR